MRKTEIAEIAVRLILGSVFLWSGLQKIDNPSRFAGEVFDYDLLNFTFGFAVSVVLPWLELVMGVLFLAGFVVEGCYGCSSLLLIIFVIAQTLVMHRGVSIKCACFGSGTGDQDVIGLVTLGRTVVILIVIVIGWAVHSVRETEKRNRKQVKQIPGACLT